MFAKSAMVFRLSNGGGAPAGRRRPPPFPPTLQMSAAATKLANPAADDPPATRTCTNQKHLMPNAAAAECAKLKLELFGA